MLAFKMNPLCNRLFSSKTIKNKTMHKVYLLVSFLVVLSACNSSKVPKDAKIVAPIQQQAVSDGNFSLADFSLQIPDSWHEETASNSMRVTQFSLKNHPEYEVVVSYFGNNANMVEANIQRWKGQFTEQEEYQELDVNNKELTGIRILGTFKLKAFPMAQDFTETPDYGTLAAILPSKEGPYYLKLTAPGDVIKAETPTFIKVLNTYKRN